MPLMPAEISRYIITSTGRTWIVIVTGCIYISSSLHTQSCTYGSEVRRDNIYLWAEKALDWRRNIQRSRKDKVCLKSKSRKIPCKRRRIPTRLPSLIQWDLRGLKEVRWVKGPWMDERRNKNSGSPHLKWWETKDRRLLVGEAYKRNYRLIKRESRCVYKRL